MASSNFWRCLSRKYAQSVRASSLPSTLKLNAPSSKLGELNSAFKRFYSHSALHFQKTDGGGATAKASQQLHGAIKARAGGVNFTQRAYSQSSREKLDLLCEWRCRLLAAAPALQRAGVSLQQAAHQVGRRHASTRAALQAPGGGQSAAHASSSGRSAAAAATHANASLAHAAAAARHSLVSGGPAAQRAVSWWLFGAAGWVFSMVVLGGVTRLTRSGLSMTDWRFSGSLPPLSAAEWETEFDKYKASPEYRRVNKGMQLEEFKFIYWMEYAHRMWGRGLGFYFAGPFLYFSARGYLTRGLSARLLLFLGLGAAQGFIGWWMVKSGLEEPKSEYVVPRVSPYRLAAHLTSAFVIYSGLLWTALSVALPTLPAVTPGQVAAALRARRLLHPAAALIGLTALSGAFVAGNDAGHAFNTFPKMGDTWLPPGLLEMQPSVRNFFENTATVQLDHRILALTTLATVGAVYHAVARLPVPPVTRTLNRALLGMTALQVTLGISTLLMYVPVSLGAAHQAGALTLFTIVLALMHSVRRPRALAAAAAAAATKGGPQLAHSRAYSTAVSVVNASSTTAKR